MPISNKLLYTKKWIDDIANAINEKDLLEQNIYVDKNTPLEKWGNHIRQIPVASNEDKIIKVQTRRAPLSDLVSSAWSVPKMQKNILTVWGCGNATFAVAGIIENNDLETDV